MKSRSIRRWIWWLLPFWVLRAFVPAGFMLSSGADGLQLVLCSGNGPVPAFQSAPDAAAERHAGHHHDSEGAGSGSHANSPCPFAIGTVACAADVAKVVATTHTPFTQKTVSYANPPLDTRPGQIDRIRGPPLSA